MPPLPPLALNHLNLPARDPAALRRWYARVLGFRPQGRFLWSAGTLLNFVPGEPIASGALHFGFRTKSRADLDAWAAAVAEQGVAVPPIETFPDSPGYATTRINDPEGNEIELFTDPIAVKESRYSRD